MTLDNLTSELRTLNEQIEKLLGETQYKCAFNLSTITYKANDPDELMMHLEFESIFRHLDFVNALFSYLEKPIFHTGLLVLNSHGDYSLDNVTLKKGDVIEILTTTDYSDVPIWNTIKIGNNVDLIGKQARFRGNIPPHVS